MSDVLFVKPPRVHTTGRTPLVPVGSSKKLDIIKFIFHSFSFIRLFCVEGTVRENDQMNSVALFLPSFLVPWPLTRYIVGVCLHNNINPTRWTLTRTFLLLLLGFHDAMNFFIHSYCYYYYSLLFWIFLSVLPPLIFMCEIGQYPFFLLPIIIIRIQKRDSSRFRCVGWRRSSEGQALVVSSSWPHLFFFPLFLLGKVLKKEEEGCERVRFFYSFSLLYSGRPIIGDNEPAQIGKEEPCCSCCVSGRGWSMVEQTSLEVKWTPSRVYSQEKKNEKKRKRRRKNREPVSDLWGSENVKNIKI